MSWKEYKKNIVVDLLSTDTGTFELTLLMSLFRHENETVRMWVQRMTEGKQAVEGKGVTLPETMYADLLLRYYMEEDLEAMVKEDQL